MKTTELYSKIIAAKSFLHAEIVRIRTNKNTVTPLSYREIGDRMDMIHEAERIGVRNLGERQTRRITRLLDQLETYQVSPNWSEFLPL